MLAVVVHRDRIGHVAVRAVDVQHGVVQSAEIDLYRVGSASRRVEAEVCLARWASANERAGTKRAACTIAECSGGGRSAMGNISAHSTGLVAETMPLLGRSDSTRIWVPATTASQPALSLEIRSVWSGELEARPWMKKLCRLSGLTVIDGGRGVGAD